MPALPELKSAPGENSCLLSPPSPRLTLAQQPHHRLPRCRGGGGITIPARLPLRQLLDTRFLRLEPVTHCQCALAVHRDRQ